MYYKPGPYWVQSLVRRPLCLQALTGGSTGRVPDFFLRDWQENPKAPLAIRARSLKADIQVREASRIQRAHPYFVYKQAAVTQTNKGCPADGPGASNMEVEWNDSV